MWNLETNVLIRYLAKARLRLPAVILSNTCLKKSAKWLNLHQFSIRHSAILQPTLLLQPTLVKWSELRHISVNLFYINSMVDAKCLHRRQLPFALGMIWRYAPTRPTLYLHTMPFPTSKINCRMLIRTYHSTICRNLTTFNSMRMMMMKLVMMIKTAIVYLEVNMLKDIT